jgi:hypothetical protein
MLLNDKNCKKNIDIGIIPLSTMNGFKKQKMAPAAAGCHFLLQGQQNHGSRYKVLVFL